MPLFLSAEDVARLLREPSPPVRGELATKLGSEIERNQLSPAELVMAQDIVRIMAKDVAAEVRAALSQSLRLATNLPHDVAVRLANDIEEVALPILADSHVLTDGDLVQLVRRGSEAKHIAIAGRRQVSEEVSDALITRAGEAAVAVLMGNATARISDASLHRAIDRFAQSDAVKDSMARRKTLPLSVTERLVVLVSEQLREYLVSHHDMPPTAAADVVMQSRERAIVHLSESASGQELEDLVAQMHANGRLTPSLVLRLLCMGDIDFFELALAQLARVPVANARILIHDAGRKGLVSLCERAGLPARLFPVIRTAVDVVNETAYDGGERDLERFRARVITRVLTQFDDFGQEDLDYLVAKLGDVLSHAA
jgi:uncharacterized protein (DUF2336 family)